MLKNSSEKRNIIRKRKPALFGLFVLALFQLSFAGHQLQHPADHGVSVCEVCTAYNQLDDVPLAAAPTADFAAPKTSKPTSALLSQLSIEVAANYQSRAPPLS